MKRLITALAITAALGAVATAEAFKAGVYAGDTQREKPVRFTASKSEVTGFKIKVQYACTDLDKFWTREKGFPAVEIGEDGEFAARFTNSDSSYTSKPGSTGAGLHTRRGRPVNQGPLGVRQAAARGRCG
jgi:hypothetical protein